MARVTSRAGYWIGGGLIVAGVVGAILWGVLSFLAIDDTVDDFARAPAPGMARVELEARKYIVYVEGPGVDRDFSPPVEILVVDPRRDRALPIAGYSASLTYSMSGHSGRAQGTGRRAARASTSCARRRPRPPRRDSRSPSATASPDGSCARSSVLFAIGGLLLAAGVALIVTTGVRRNRRRAGPAPPSDHVGLAGLPG